MNGTYSIVLDLGGTNLRVAAYAEGSGLLDSILLPTWLAENRERVVRDLCNAVQTLAGKD